MYGKLASYLGQIEDQDSGPAMDLHLQFPSHTYQLQFLSP